MDMESKPDKVKGYAVQPIVPDNLDEVVRFLVGWRTKKGADGASAAPGRDDPNYVGRNLKWILLDNPAAHQGRDCGLCLRDESGRMVGTLLFFHGAFRLGDRTLSGLSSGSFFVLPEARMHGFFMLKKYFNSPNCDFWYATSCNANSGPLWQKLGGVPIRGSDFEYLVPMRAGRLAAVAARNKRLPSALVHLAHLAGGVVTPCFRVMRSSRLKLRVNLCMDWERLAWIAERHRPSDLLTAERSPEQLQWRYEASPALQRREVYTFAASGHEGWVSIGRTKRGQRRDIETAALLDVVWPRKQWAYGDVLAAIVREVDAACDLFLVGGSAASVLRNWECGAIRRRLAGPQSYVRSVMPGCDGNRLAPLADFALADGDALD